MKEWKTELSVRTCHFFSGMSEIRECN